MLFFKVNISHARFFVFFFEGGREKYSSLMQLKTKQNKNKTHTDAMFTFDFIIMIQK